MDPASQTPTLPKRSAYGLVVRIVVTGTLIGAAAYLLNWRPVVDVVTSADPVLVSAAFGTYLAAAFVMAERWRRMLQIDRASVPLVTCFRLYLESFLVGLALPSFVGGDAYRGVRVRRRLDTAARVAVNVVAERIIGAIALFGLAAGGLLAYPAGGLSFGTRALIVLATAAAAAVGTAAVVRIRRLGPHIAQARAYLSPASRGASLLALSTTAHVLGATSVYFAALSVGVGLEWSFYVVLLPALWMLSLIPALGGIGPKEGGLILALTGTGVVEQTAVAATAVVLASRLFASALGGASLLAGSEDG